MKHTPSLFLIVLLLISAAALGGEFPIATDTWSQSYPVIAYGNGQYYVVFSDHRQYGQYEHWGRFVSREGAVSAEHQLVDTWYMQFMHELAFGETGYLFAWSRQRTYSNYTRDAYGRVITLDGDPAGSQFRVSIGNSDSANFINCAFDGQKYLVVWQEGSPGSGCAIRGQFVAPDGQLIGDNFSIRPDDLDPTVDQIYPDLLALGTGFLVVWDDDRAGNRDIYAQFLDPQGNLTGEDITLTTDSSDQLLVQVAAAGSDFLAVWADERDHSYDNGIYGQRFSTDGLVGDNFAISPAANDEERSWPAIAGSGSQYLVAWTHTIEEKNALPTPLCPNEQHLAAGVTRDKPVIWYDIHARAVALDGSLLGDELLVCTEAYHQNDPKVASDGRRFLVAWADSREDNAYYDVYGSFIESSDCLQTYYLPYVREDGDYRFNLGFSNLCAEERNIAASLYAPDGTVDAVKDYIAPGQCYKPVYHVINDMGGSTDQGCMTLQTSEPLGIIGGPVDNVTSDPSILAVRKQAARELITPIVLSSDPWKTRLALQNTASETASVTLSFYKVGNFIQPSHTLNTTIPGNGNYISDDIVSALGAPAGSYGSLRVSADQDLAGFCHQYTTAHTGGLYPVYCLQDARTVFYFPYVSDTMFLRANLGLVHTGTGDLNVEVAFYSGGLLDAIRTITLQANQYAAIPDVVRWVREATGAQFASGCIRLTAPQPFFAIGGVINTTSNDPGVQAGQPRCNQGYTPIVLKADVWATRLVLANYEDEDIMVTLNAYNINSHALDGTGQVMVSARDIAVCDDIIAFLGLPDLSVKRLEIIAAGALVPYVYQYTSQNTAGVYPFAEYYR